MKKTLITLALTVALSASALLVSCGGNTATDGNATESTTAQTTEKAETEKDIIDGAESMIDDARRGIEDSTHGVYDGFPGGHSSRGGNMHLFPRGK